MNAVDIQTGRPYRVISTRWRLGEVYVRWKDTGEEQTIEARRHQENLAVAEAVPDVVVRP